jgi:hypothetical protein
LQGTAVAGFSAGRAFERNPEDLAISGRWDDEISSPAGYTRPERLVSGNETATPEVKPLRGRSVGCIPSFEDQKVPPMLKNIYVRVAIIIVLVILLYYLVITLGRSTAEAFDGQTPIDAPQIGEGDTQPSCSVWDLA